MPTVLVVDDSPVARLALSRALRAAGFAVVEASSVAEGGRHDPDAVDLAVLDLDLGDGDGVELLEALRAGRPGLPAVFFSGGAPAPLLRRAEALSRVFRKPDELAGVVDWARRAAVSEQR